MKSISPVRGGTTSCRSPVVPPALPIKRNLQLQRSRPRAYSPVPASSVLHPSDPDRQSPAASAITRHVIKLQEVRSPRRRPSMRTCRTAGVPLLLSSVRMPHPVAQHRVRDGIQTARRPAGARILSRTPFSERRGDEMGISSQQTSPEPPGSKKRCQTNPFFRPGDPENADSTARTNPNEPKTNPKTDPKTTKRTQIEPKRTHLCCEGRSVLAREPSESGRCHQVVCRCDSRTLPWPTSWPLCWTHGDT